MNKKLKLKAFYPHPPQQVWAALTDPAALATWFMPTDLKPLMGFRFRFEGLGRSSKGAVECEVVDVDPESRIAYLWDDGEDGSPSLVRWTLKPKDGGTELELEHESLAEPKPYVLIEAAMNWRYAMYGSLPALLGRPPVPIVYEREDDEEQGDPTRRAGFRQEATACR